MELIVFLFGYLAGFVTTVSVNVPWYVSAGLCVVFVLWSISQTAPLYPWDGKTEKFDNNNQNWGAKVFLYVIALFFFFVALESKYAQIEYSWLTILSIYFGVGIVSVFVAWLTINQAHVIAISYMLAKRGFNNFDTLVSGNIVKVGDMLQVFKNNHFQAFTVMDFGFGCYDFEKVREVHVRYLKFIEHKRDTVHLDDDFLKSENAGIKGVQATRGDDDEDEDLVMFPHSLVSRYYPSFSAADANIHLAKAWLYCLHTNDVNENFVSMLRKNLVLRPRYFRGVLISLVFTWPVHLMSFFWQDALRAIKTFVLRMFGNAMTYISRKFIQNL